MTTLFKDEVLARAYEAIKSPEVQALVRQLSKHNLGVFMPHMHDHDGGFQDIPFDTVIVEDDLVVSFHPRDFVASNSESFVPVGWTWDNRSGVVARQYCIRYGQVHPTT